MTNYYLDTCIWRDYFENCKDKFRPLGEWAFRFIKQLIDNKDILIVSNVVIMELEKEYSDVGKILSIAKNIGVYINYSPTQVNEAKNITKESNIPFADALHAILARDSHCVLITRDRHFFDKINFIEIYKPEDLI